MRFVPQNLKRFSLRGLFIVLTLTALYLGLHVSKVRENKAAIRQLRSRGAALWCTTMDPIGPDFLYTWSTYRIPNGYFSPWFENHLCIEVQDIVFLENTTITQEDIQLLAKVPLVSGAHFRDSELEPETVATISRTCRFEDLCFENTPLSDKDFSELAKMRWLQRLFLLGTNAEAEGIARLRNELANCEILSE